MIAQSAADPRLERVVLAIPTRNRADLAERALASVMHQLPDLISVVISDNSTDVDEVGRLRSVSAAYPSVTYIRPPRPLDMASHWEWALSEALAQTGASHAMFIGDRTIVRPSQLAVLIECVAAAPDMIMTFGSDGVDDHTDPVRLNTLPWSWRVVTVSSARELQLASKLRLLPAFPRFTNSIAPVPVLDAIRARFGTVFGSPVPDVSFGFRALTVVDALRYYDAPAAVNWSTKRSTGHSYNRGVPSAALVDFFHDAGGPGSLNFAAPIPGVETLSNYVAHEYNLLRESVGSDRLPPVDIGEYVEAIADDITRMRNAELAQRTWEALERFSGSAGTLQRPGTVRRRVRSLPRDPRTFARRAVTRASGRLLAAAWTRPIWSAASRLGPRPPTLRWFRFDSADDALAYATRFRARAVRNPDHLAALLGQRD